MSAVLTLGTVAVDATGKVMTATISGGTGTGYAITNATGLKPRITSGPGYSFPIASVSVSGSTLTINLAVPLGTTDTVQLDIASTSNLTDSGANTATGQTNLAVTNSSTVVVTKFDYSSNVFELHGKMSTGTQGGTDKFVRFPTTTFVPYEYGVEFVCDATEIAMLALASASSAQIDGGADTATTFTANPGAFGVHALTTTPLASGKHLVRLIFGDYFLGIRLTGGARTMHLVPTTKQTILGGSGTYPGMANTAGVVTAYGAYSANAATGAAAVSNYVGMTFDTKFTGSGVEIVTVASVSAAWSASVDGGPEGALLPGGDSTVNNVYAHVPLATGRTQGAQHTLHATLIGVGGATTHKWLRVVNGSALASAASIGNTTISVASVTNIAVNDWLRIDALKNLELRQVTAITGTGPYTLTLGAALAKAHAVGAAVTSYSAPAGALTAWSSRDLSAKRVVAIGDSNTQGANDYGQAGTPDANGTYYGLYDPRSIGFYQACQLLGYELVNLGIAGQWTAQMASRAADISTYGHGAADVVLVWAGTNDINGAANPTPDQWKASVQTIITAAVPLLRTGGKVVVVPTPTPNGLTNSGGLNLATMKTKITELVAANPGVVVDGGAAVARILVADENGVHYHPSGQAKIGQDVIPLLVTTHLFTNVSGAPFPVAPFTKI